MSLPPPKRKRDGEEQEMTQARCKRSPEPPIITNEVGLMDIPAFVPQAISNADAERAKVAAPSDPIVQLSDEDLENVAVIRRQRPSAKQYEATIETFIEQALRKQFLLESDHGPLAAMAYFDNIKAAALDKGATQDSAEQTHSWLVVGWQKRVAAWLGRSVRSLSELQDISCDIATNAERTGGIRTDDRLARSLFECIDDFQQETVDVSRTLPPSPPQSFGREVSQSGSLLGPLLDHLKDDAEAYDVHEQQVHPATSSIGTQQQIDAQLTTLCDRRSSPKALRPTQADQVKATGEMTAVQSVKSIALQARFPEAFDLFFYHHKRARAEQTGYSSEAERYSNEPTKRASREEFDSLSAHGRSAWTELHKVMLDIGKEEFLDPTITAKFFCKGRAHSPAVPKSPNDTLDGVTNGSPSSAFHIQEGGPVPSTTFPEPVAEQPTVPKPLLPTRNRTFVVGYEKLDQPSRIFVAVNWEAKSDKNEYKKDALVRACQKSIPGGKDTDVFNSQHYFRKRLVAFTFLDMTIARRAAYQTFVFGKSNPRAIPWPVSVPTVFMAFHMAREGPRVVRKDALFAGIHNAFPDLRVHFRKEKTPSKSESTMWLVMFDAAPGCLRFSVTVLQADNDSYKPVWFEPVAPERACPICTDPHPAQQCEGLQAVSYKELKISKHHEQYMNKLL
ncbi:hypothetical protein LTR86_009577 [Recurvomyces mirabilis]|nr:hypothetical protein LTR86_009577 [Recurvomyces mirabilis]